MALFIIRETGMAGGYVTHDVYKGQELIAPGIEFGAAETIVRDLMGPNDLYREEYLGGGACDMSYEARMASWAATAKWERGEI